MASNELERPDLDTEIWKRLGIKSAKKIADELGLKPTELLSVLVSFLRAWMP